jgi:hypothetical protein
MLYCAVSKRPRFWILSITTIGVGVGVGVMVGVGVGVAVKAGLGVADGVAGTGVLLGTSVGSGVGAGAAERRGMKYVRKAVPTTATSTIKVTCHAAKRRSSPGGTGEGFMSVYI